jgi:hypothetical protein
VADISYIKSVFGGVDDAVKKAADQAFTYLLNNLTLGAPEEAKRSKNFQWYWFSGTTSSVANQEFSIAHGLQKVPNVVMQVLPLSQVGAQVVPLQVSRAADMNRLYFTSASTSAVFWVLVE